MTQRHNRYAVPTGRVQLSNRNGNHVPTRAARKAASERSIIATASLRQRLVNTEVVQSLNDSSWQHVRDGIVVATFPDLSTAINAI